MSISWPPGVSLTLVSTDSSIHAYGFTTAAGATYAVFTSNVGNSLKVYKDLDSTPAAAATDESRNTMHGGLGGNILGTVHAAMDSDDRIHVISRHRQHDSTSAGYPLLVYRVFDTDTDAWVGSWETIETTNDELQQVQGQCWISIDSNDYPHVITTNYIKYHGTPYPQAVYYERTGGSWSSAEQISEVDNVDIFLPRIAHCPADDIEAMYASTGVTYYKRRNGSWGSESTYARAPTNNSLSQWGIIVDTSDNVYRYANITTAIWENNTSIKTINANAYDGVFPAMDPDGGRHFIHDEWSSQSFTEYSWHNGASWTDEGRITDLYFNYATLTWAYNNQNWPGYFHFLVWDGDAQELYWGQLPEVVSSVRRVFITHG